MTLSVANTHSTLAQLRRQWWALAATYAALLVLVSLALARQWQPASAVRWGVLAALVLTYQLWVLWQRLLDNHRSDGLLLPTLGLANLLSLLRGLLLGFLAGFLFQPWPPGWLAWAPGTLYTVAILLDLLDGIAARLTNRTTALGAVLDMEFDALGILVAPLLGVWYGQLPAWYLLASVARYLFVLGIRRRERRHQPIYDLPLSTMRRPLAGIQMGFTSAVLWPVLEPPATTIAATLVMIPFVLGFLRDWLAVSGRIDPTSTRYQRVHHSVTNIFRRWLPVLLRLLVTVLWAELLVLRWPGIPAVAGWLLVGLVVFGIFGRLAATLLLVFAGIALAGSGGGPGGTALITTTSLLMLLGTGALSVWQPEELFLSHRLGEKG